MESTFERTEIIVIPYFLAIPGQWSHIQTRRQGPFIPSQLDCGPLNVCYYIINLLDDDDGTNLGKKN